MVQEDTEAAVVTNEKPAGIAAPSTAHAPAVVESPIGTLYDTPGAALKEVRSDYLYWTGKLTDTSVQLSYALIAANWAVFGSVERILNNPWSRLSLGLVVIGLGVNLIVAKWMGELHRERIDYAESDRDRWDAEFVETVGKRVAWPFTRTIELIGSMSRWVKVFLPLAGGVAFLLALL